MSSVASPAQPTIRSHNYKALKEQFVSNHNGSSIWEINAITLILPAGVLVWSALQARGSFFTPYTPLACAADWLISCGAVLAALTVYAGAPLLLNGLLLLPAVISVASSRRLGAPPTTPQKRAAAAAAAARRASAAAAKQASAAAAAAVAAVAAGGAAGAGGSAGGSATAAGGSGAALVGGALATDRAAQLPAKPFLSMYRGAMLVATCACILAVDFPVFPRRLAKVETWGTSLMDLGVGSFVFAAGVVAPRRVLAQRLGGRRAEGLAARLRGALVSSAVLLMLGAARTWSVKAVGYSEHVTEYGVHWNFFFTLGLLPPVVAVLQGFVDLVPHEIVALLIAVLYEVALDNTELTAYIISAPRDNLLSQNREGMCSFIGYLAIFLAGEGTGMFLLPRQTSIVESPPKASFVSRVRQFLTRTPNGKLLAYGSLYAALFLLSTEYRGFNLRVSRRLANLPYVLWVCSFNNIQLLLCAAIQDFFFPNLIPTDLSILAGRSRSTSAAAQESRLKEARDELARRTAAATSRVLAGFNRNGLAIFLLANLLTGAVNLALPTLHASTPVAMAVLVAYMGILGGVAVWLPKIGI